MILHRLFSFLALSAGLTTAVRLTGYEYVIVGSGAGGGPLAARLALAGHKTLLIEAGDDQGHNDNYTVPAYSAKSSEDPAMTWNFFVHNYGDDERQARNYKTTYETPDGGEYTGLNPPEGSKIKGTLYPRTQALGGCTAHNALIAIYPHRSDLEYVADLTGDDSWSPENMRKYFVKMENNGYLPPGAKGHGYNGWFSTETGPNSIVEKDAQFKSLLGGGGFALGNKTGKNFGPSPSGDANADTEKRDTENAYYPIPIATHDNARNGAREFIVAVRDATNDDGSKKYPLDVRTNAYVTKVIFDHSSNPPRAIGVEFLDGKYLYKASPRSKTSASGTPGSATASREVIVAGGVYNSPQILKLSGVGPAEELKKFGIDVVADLPGVGTNLQDHYEVAVQGHTPKNFSSLNGCTWGFWGQPDPCLKRWKNPENGNRGIYSSAGLAAAMYYKSSATSDGSYDVFLFGGPINFRGFFPGHSINITERHDWFTWDILKAHPRNRAGHVTLQSADPLDVPKIVFNYFDAGTGDYEADLQAIYESVELSRDAFARQDVKISETIPGSDVKSKEDITTYAKDTAWGHHASCTCPIGADDDPMAVLDSKFRVRGVQGLRVVDASVYPRIPGTFTAVSTYLAAEKAADVILSGLESN
ncbi:Choline dehydrogenase [Aspergillus sclerotialis]|uniref:Choline dehydrogenase n=1 Tax=Aspergillus sclerotialis TaxID=2070753 RepID=A0A3A2ZQ88_9EURO|nr:Choline dehydrogenase [Aspergillus sclerotialis]